MEDIRDSIRELRFYANTCSNSHVCVVSAVFNVRKCFGIDGEDLIPVNVATLSMKSWHQVFSSIGISYERWLGGVDPLAVLVLME